MRLAFVAVPALLAGLAAASQAQTTPAPAVTAATAAPEVGQAAPDFTLPWADANGPRATPLTLSSLRGKVVVLAFYPKDRTGGCTAELTKFRDQYTTLFGKRAGRNVVVVPISADGVASHADWAKESKFPFALVADTGLTAVTQYGSRMDGAPMSKRTVFVIGKDGVIKYRDLRFDALNEDEYAKLKAAVEKEG